MYRINKSLLLFAVLIPIFAFGQNESKKLLQSSTSSEINDTSSKLKLTVIDSTTISNFKLDNSIKQELKQADIYNSKTQKEDCPC